MAITEGGIEYNVGDKYDFRGHTSTIITIGNEYIKVKRDDDRGEFNVLKEFFEPTVDDGTRKLHIKTVKMNKYNLVVGTKITLDWGTWTVGKVNATGVNLYQSMNTSGNVEIYEWSFDALNEGIDSGKYSIKQPVKQEIIGYELLKDLPDIPAGLKSIKKSASGWSFENLAYQIYFTEKQIKDTTWFKPIYKKKEIELVISSNRKIVVSFDLIHIVGHDTLTYKQFDDIFAYMFPTTKFKSKYIMSAELINVGCQTYTKKDIQDVKNAIQSLD